MCKATHACGDVWLLVFAPTEVWKGRAPHMSFFRRRQPITLELSPDAPSAPPKAQPTDRKAALRAQRLSVAVRKLNFGTSQMEATTKQILSAITAIGSQMDTQKQSITRTMEIISELGAFAQEISASVTQVATSSDQTASTLTEGKTAVQQSVDQIQQIQQVVGSNAAAVRDLGDKTQEIGKIVTTIRDIASQTNLLALNAAIEAARAGDHGRGFAVVADEVKKLAEGSGQAAAQIGKLINAIKTSATQTVAALGEGMQSVNEGSRVILTAGKSMDRIIGAVAETNHLVSDISEAVSQQATNTDRLLQVIDSMKVGLEQVAVFVETAVFEAEQQRASLQTLLGSTKDLDQMESSLRQALFPKGLDTDMETDPYIMGLPSDPVTLDPGMSRDTNSNNIIRELFVGLLQVGEDGKPVPALASTWHLEDDGRTYTFLLREDAFFHHGRQVESHDLKYSIERLLKPGSKSPHGGLFAAIVGAEEFSQGRAAEVKGIRLHGRFKLSIELTNPNLVFLSTLANNAASIVPKEIVEKLGDEQFSREPVGCGSFVFDKWVQGQQLELRANPRYFEGRPYIDRVLVRIYPGNDALLQAFFAGEVGHLRIDSTGYELLQRHPQYRSSVVEMTPVDVQYCALMCTKPPFDNKLVRQAACYAFDRAKYLREALQGQAVLSNGPLPPSFTGITAGGYPYEPEKGKALMRQAGYGNGYPGEVILHVRANNAEQSTRAEAIASDLGRIGLNVKVITLPWVELGKPENMAKCHMFLMAATGGHAEGAPYLGPYFHSHSIGKGNRVSYHSTAVDQLLDEAETIANPQRRKDVYIQAHKILSDDAPFMFLFHPQNYVARQSDVKGLRVGTGGEVPLKYVWLDTD